MAAKYGEGESSDEEEAASDAEDAVATLLTTQAEPAASTSKKRKNNDPDYGVVAQTGGTKRKESHVWRFYDRKPDRTKCCKICFKAFSANTATGALRKHLTSHLGEQTDAILSSAQSAMEVTISPSTNTVTVSGLPSSFADTVIATTPLPRKRRAFALKTAPASAPSLATVKSELDSEGKVRKSRYKSAVWDHFTRHEDGRPECLHCHYVYSSNASTSGLRRHAENHEKERLGEPTGRGSKTGAAKQSSTMSTPNTANKPVPRPALSLPLMGEENFLKLIIKQHLPAAEVPEHYATVYRLATGKLPNSAWIDNKIKLLYSRKKEEIKLYLKQSVGKISLSLEIWTSATRYSFLIVMAHLMTENWDPVRFMLDCVLLSPDVQSDMVKDHLTAILEEFDCSQKIMAIATADERCTVDGASGALVSQALQLYKIYAHHSGGPDIAQVHCIGSGLGYCVEPALTCASLPLDKIRRFLKVLMNSGKTAELQNHSHLCLEDYYELKLDTPATWTSTVIMLDAAVKMKNVIDDLIKQTPDMYDAFSPEDWIILSCTLELDVGKTEYPPLSIALPLMEYLTTHLTTQKDRPDYPAWVKKLSRDMLERTNTILHSLLTDVYFFGTILDPRHKLSTLPDSVNRLRVEETLRTAFGRYLPQSAPTAAAESGGAAVSNGMVNTYKAGSLMSAILKKTHAATVQPQLDELNQYLNTSVEGPDVDPLKWWENYRKVYPHLALMARDYMCVSATSVSSDELFVKEKSAGKWRNRLGPEDMLTYVCLKSWIDLDFRTPAMTNGAVIGGTAAVKT